MGASLNPMDYPDRRVLRAELGSLFSQGDRSAGVAGEDLFVGGLSIRFRQVRVDPDRLLKRGECGMMIASQAMNEPEGMMRKSRVMIELDRFIGHLLCA